MPRGRECAASPISHIRAPMGPMRTLENAPRVLILSDVRLYRDGLAMTLAARHDIVLVGAVDSVDAALNTLQQALPTVLLLDTSMSRALEIARAVMRVAPETSIVAVAVADDSDDVVACARA